ncbi:unnamed protein product [Periconia digitata]|uniref:Uncharacterized protein n=1 Tax=Periconia digitata TaxID=1303443 RepID=A0A9W4URZ9_9PLEO|nr:unnamed protein product [Periconia digitata]
MADISGSVPPIASSHAAKLNNVVSERVLVPLTLSQVAEFIFDVLPGELGVEQQHALRAALEKRPNYRVFLSVPVPPAIENQDGVHERGEVSSVRSEDRVGGSQEWTKPLRTPPPTDLVSHVEKPVRPLEHSTANAIAVESNGPPIKVENNRSSLERTIRQPPMAKEAMTDPANSVTVETADHVEQGTVKIPGVKNRVDSQQTGTAVDSGPIKATYGFRLYEIAPSPPVTPRSKGYESTVPNTPQSPVFRQPNFGDLPMDVTTAFYCPDADNIIAGIHRTDTEIREFNAGIQHLKEKVMRDYNTKVRPWEESPDCWSTDAMTPSSPSSPSSPSPSHSHLTQAIVEQDSKVNAIESKATVPSRRNTPPPQALGTPKPPSKPRVLTTSDPLTEVQTEKSVSALTERARRLRRRTTLAEYSSTSLLSSPTPTTGAKRHLQDEEPQDRPNKSRKTI